MTTNMVLESLNGLLVATTLVNTNRTLNLATVL
jgi:hypothetical protein